MELTLTKTKKASEVQQKGTEGQLSLILTNLQDAENKIEVVEDKINDHSSQI